MLIRFDPNRAEYSTPGASKRHLEKQGAFGRIFKATHDIFESIPSVRITGNDHYFDGWYFHTNEIIKVSKPTIII